MRDQDGKKVAIDWDKFNAVDRTTQMLKNLGLEVSKLFLSFKTLTKLILSEHTSTHKLSCSEETKQAFGLSTGYIFLFQVNEFDTTIQGPWMRQWEIVHVNRHTDAFEMQKSAVSSPQSEAGRYFHVAVSERQLRQVLLTALLNKCVVFSSSIL